MLSIDTNILLYAYASKAPQHSPARDFLVRQGARQDVALSEFVLTELYVLLRNPSVLEHALSAAQAAAVVQAYRSHPCWQIVGFPPDSRALHDRMWADVSSAAPARRAIFDLRLALCLQAFGVTRLATANVRDFEGLGFNRVWNPLVEPSD